MTYGRQKSIDRLHILFVKQYSNSIPFSPSGEYIDVQTQQTATFNKIIFSPEKPVDAMSMIFFQINKCLQVRDGSIAVEKRSVNSTSANLHFRTAELPFGVSQAELGSETRSGKRKCQG